MSTARGNPRTYGRTDELTNVSLPTVDILQVRYAHEQQEDSRTSVKCGTYAGYQEHKARGQESCGPCRTANVAYCKRWVYDTHNGRARTVPALGTVRRLEALNALGWSWPALGGMLGMGTNAWRVGRGRPVLATTARRVAALFDELHMTPGPSTRTRASAARKGLAPPLAWDDIDDPKERPKMPLYGLSALAKQAKVVDVVAAERAASGEPVQVTVHERALAVALLAGRGHNDGEISRRLRITDRTVARIRGRSGIPAAGDSGRSRTA